jgi:hypothetical protein
MEVTLIYGRDSITKNLNHGARVSDIATATNLNVIGAPTDNLRFSIDGDIVDANTVLTMDGTEIYVESKPHSKA